MGRSPKRPLETMALKAKFSQHALTQEELDSFSQRTRAIAVKTRNGLSGWKRLRFRWISCLDPKKK